MGKRILITTPFPTAEEVAKDFGMSDKRLAEIKALVDRIHEQHEAAEFKRGGHATRRKPTRKESAKRH